MSSFRDSPPKRSHEDAKVIVIDRCQADCFSSAMVHDPTPRLKDVEKTAFEQRLSRGPLHHSSIPGGIPAIALAQRQRPLTGAGNERRPTALGPRAWVWAVTKPFQSPC
jgi:hypothetical protein